jgi:hypothetical protein
VIEMNCPRRWLLSAILTVLTCAAAVEAAEPWKPLDAPRLKHAAQLGWLRARIVSGRVVFAAARLGTMNDEKKEVGREERLRIRVASGELTARYEMSSGEEEFLVDVRGRTEFRVRRGWKGDAGPLPVDFHQPATGPLRLSVGFASEEKTYEAASLWHLFLAQPEACREYLAPLLAVFSREWDVSRTSEQVEAALVRAAAEGDLPDPKRWAELVEQLGDDKFSRRRAADRELRRLGRVVHTYLEQLDSSQLDAEQRYRVRRILTSLSPGTDDDTPPQIAAWLAGDPTVWLAMLSRQDEATRRLAGQRLEALLGEPIDFDPTAEPQAREAQIERLRTRLSERG